MPNEFEREPVGAGQVASPEHRAAQEATERVGKAKGELGIIEAFVKDGGGGPKEVDGTVAAYVTEGKAAGEGPALIGIEEVLQDPDAMQTPHALREEEPVVIAEALQDELAAGLPEETVKGVLDRIDGSGVEYGEKEPGLPPAITGASVLLRLTSERNGISLKKLEHTIPDAGPLLSSLNHLPKPTEEERQQTTQKTLSYLQSRPLSLAAPVAAGSVGAEAYDKTQRDRAMFRAGKTGGAGSHESYCSKLFAGASNPEIQEYVARSLEGKRVINLGGGNAAIGHELMVDHGVRDVDIINVEPYPSAAIADNPDADPICVANPAEKDFIDVSGIQPHSAEEIWAEYSVPAYLGTPEEAENLLANIQTMLKPGGIARIGHLGFVGGGMDDPRKGALIDSLRTLGDQGYLIEVVAMPSGDETLILTAPRGESVHGTDVVSRPAREATGFKPSAAERARVMAEKMGGDTTPEGLRALEQRIELEDHRDRPRIGPNYVGKALALYENDFRHRMGLIGELARRDSEGTLALSDEALVPLLCAIDDRVFTDDDIKDMFTEEKRYLSLLMAEQPIDTSDKNNMVAHAKALRIVIEQAGSTPRDWVKLLELGRGDQVPDIARHYLEKPGFQKIVLGELFQRRPELYKSLDMGSSTIDRRREAQEELKETLEVMLRTLMGNDPTTARLASQFLKGDIGTYGYDHEKAIRTPAGDFPSAMNRRGFVGFEKYLDNVEALGVDGVKLLHEQLGTINFGDINPNTLMAMQDILLHPEKHPRISVIVRGQDSDHNGFVSNTLSTTDMKDTLIFEVNEEGDMAHVNQTLNRLNVAVERVTLMGHGNEHGLGLSSRYGIGRELEQLSRDEHLLALLQRITLDENGKQSVVLWSCSQGKRYDKAGSLAQNIVKALGGPIAVDAAPGLLSAFANTSTTDGELTMWGRPKEERMNKLKRRLIRNIPAVRRYIDRLNAERAPMSRQFTVQGETVGTGYTRIGR